MSELWTDQTYQRFPDRDCHGAEEIRAYFEATFAAIPDLRVEILALVEQGDEVLVRWRLSGTQQGRLQGLEGTGRPDPARRRRPLHAPRRQDRLELRDLRSDSVGPPDRADARRWLDRRPRAQGRLQRPRRSWRGRFRRAAARRSARRPRGRRASTRRTRSRDAAARARPRSRTAPGPSRGAGSRHPRPPTARARRGAGGRRRRRWSRPAVRRSRPRPRRRAARPSRLVGVALGAGRAHAEKTTDGPSSSHAPSERVARSAPVGRAPRAAALAEAVDGPRRARCRARGRAARGPPCRRARLLGSAGGERRLELELEARPSAPRSAPASARAARASARVRPGSVELVPVRALDRRARPRRPRRPGRGPRTARRARCPGRRRAPARASPKKPASRSANANVIASVKPSPPSGRARSRGAPRQAVGVDVDRGALDVAGPRRAAGRAAAARRAATIMRSA